MLDFPNILVIKVADADDYIGGVPTVANFLFAKENGIEAIHERWNLLPMAVGQKNAGKYGIYLPGSVKYTPSSEENRENWLVFMVSTPKEGGRSLIAWYEKASLLKDSILRTDQRATPEEKGIHYQILAAEAYAFLSRDTRPFVEGLKKFPGKKAGFNTGAILCLRDGGENKKSFSDEVIQELLELRSKSLKSRKAVQFSNTGVSKILKKESENFIKASLSREAELAGFRIEKVPLEGGIRVVTNHIQRERDTSLRPRFLSFFEKKNGYLHCENCNFPESMTFQGGEVILEVHHKIPLASADQKRPAKVEDCALLCPNCHRAVHRGLIEGFLKE